MNLLRAFAFAVCLVPVCLSGGMAVAAQPAAQAAPSKVKPAQKTVQKKSQAVPRKAAKPASAKRKTAKPVSKAVAKPLPKPKLDLSLPVEMVNDLEPSLGSKTGRRKPLLPSMFPSKPVEDDSPFQLNGRLISNEMQLQLRNDSRRDVEGAAIEFEYRQ
ncbi:hypothetical protein E2H86_21345 [Pseudomonas putida]|uniref:hypothetical protein n=1 Tax=Pseudomonas putida TaxID=303 RepID=UPI0010592D26|nr:hypothetical protein [Pseudomonas putida]TDJ74050.1 hypothetical protein E2H86_21345 [Pseudomonas putida]